MSLILLVTCIELGQSPEDDKPGKERWEFERPDIELLLGCSLDSLWLDPGYTQDKVSDPPNISSWMLECSLNLSSLDPGYTQDKVSDPPNISFWMLECSLNSLSLDPGYTQDKVSDPPNISSWMLEFSLDSSSLGPLRNSPLLSESSSSSLV
jgi:hypothetical protein